MDLGGELARGGAVDAQRPVAGQGGQHWVHGVPRHALHEPARFQVTGLEKESLSHDLNAQNETFCRKIKINKFISSTVCSIVQWGTSKVVPVSQTNRPL